MNFLKHIWPWSRFYDYEWRLKERAQRVDELKKELDFHRQEHSTALAKLQEEKDRHEVSKNGLRHIATTLALRGNFDKIALVLVLLFVCFAGFAGTPVLPTLLTTNPTPILSSISGPMLTTNGAGKPTLTYNGGALTNLPSSSGGNTNLFWNPATYLLGYIIPNGINNIGGAGSILGVDLVGIGTPPSFTTSASTTPNYQSFTTQGTANNTSGFSFNNYVFPLPNYTVTEFKQGYTSTNKMRAWIGKCQFPGPANLQSLTLAGALGEAFRFDSTNDIHWMVYCNNGTASTIDTGVRPDTANHTFRIVSTISNATFFIDGSLVATSVTSLTNSANVSVVDGVCTFENVAKELKFFVYWQAIPFGF